MGDGHYGEVGGGFQQVEKGSPLVRKQVEKETKIINGGVNILKCAGFWVERTSRKMREKSAKRCS